MKTPKCGLCSSYNVRAHLNIGWDVDETGEEYQHANKCGDCGAIQYWSVFVPYGKPNQKWYGPWKKEERKQSVLEP